MISMLFAKRLFQLGMLLMANASSGLATDGTMPANREFVVRSEQLAVFIRSNLLAPKAESFDWNEAGRMVAKLAEEFPEAKGWEIRNPVAHTLRGATRFGPDRGAYLMDLYKRSPNAAVRQVANGRDILAAAKIAPLDLRFTAVDGQLVDLEKLRGKLVLIHFWATWCGPCKEQMPLLAKVYQDYQARGFEVIGITCESKPEDLGLMLAVGKKYGISWPQYFDGKSINGNQFALSFGFVSIPAFLLIGHDGLLLTQTGSSGGLTNLEEVVRRHLNLPPLNADDENKELGVRQVTSSPRIIPVGQR